MVKRNGRASRSRRPEDSRTTMPKVLHTLNQAVNYAWSASATVNVHLPDIVVLRAEPGWLVDVSSDNISSRDVCPMEI